MTELADTTGQVKSDTKAERSGSGIPSRDLPAGTMSNLRQPDGADSRKTDTAKIETQPLSEKIERPAEPLPTVNSVVQLAVRETLQKPVPIDFTSPKIVDRLASEIIDVADSAGIKKFEINPRNLGRMEITFTTRGTEEFISIQTENRAAKDMIAQHSQVLQELLKSQGREDLTVRVDVKESALPLVKKRRHKPCPAGKS